MSLDPILLVPILEDLINSGGHSRTCTHDRFSNASHPECQCGRMRAVKNAQRMIEKLKSREPVGAGITVSNTTPIQVPIYQPKQREEDIPETLRIKIERMSFHRDHDKDQAFKQVQIMKLLLQEAEAKSAHMRHALSILLKAVGVKYDLWIKIKGQVMPWVTNHARPAVSVESGRRFLEILKMLGDRKNWKVENNEIKWLLAEPWEMVQNLFGSETIEDLFEHKDDSGEKYREYLGEVKKENTTREDQGLPPIEPRTFLNWVVYCYK